MHHIISLYAELFGIYIKFGHLSKETFREKSFKSGPAIKRPVSCWYDICTTLFSFQKYVIPTEALRTQVCLHNGDSINPVCILHRYCSFLKALQETSRVFEKCSSYPKFPGRSCISLLGYAHIRFIFFFIRIKSIGQLEVHGKFGYVQRRQITLDCDGISLNFVLWGDQILLGNLFR